jgi:hypothetical protein
MVNTVLTPDIIANEALLILENNLAAASVVYRDYEQEFGGARVGDTITIRKPASFSVNEFTSSITKQDITESSVSLQLEKHFDVSTQVTSKELTLDLDGFSQRVVEPAMVALAEQIDGYIYDQYSSVHNFSGTAGTPPASLANLASIDQILNEQKVPMAGRVAFMNPAAKASMMAIEAVVTAEKRGDGGAALTSASMGRVMGMDFYGVQGVKAHTAGSQGGQSGLLVNGTVAAAATTMNADAAHAAAATLKKGDIFTVAGASGSFVVTADKTASGSAFTGIAFSPAAPAGGFADNAAITVVGDHAANLAGHPRGLALAVAPLSLPMDASGRAAIVSSRGLSIRVVQDYDINSKTDVISFDVLCGAKVVQPELLTRVLG